MLSEVLNDLHWEESHAGAPWLESLPGIPSEPVEQSQRVIDAIAHVGAAMERLHSVGYALAGFRPEMLMKSDSGIRFRNLQGRIARVGKAPDSMSVSPAYSAPEVVEPSPVSPATDVFHLATLFYGLATRRAPQGTTIEGLRACRYSLPRFRIYDPTFPTGFEHIWRKAMNTNPSRRFATVSDFVTALKTAQQDLRQRAAGEVALKFDVGAGTEIGKIKKLRYPVNQDTIYPDPAEGESSTLPERGQGILAIADGVSRCEHGSGDQASRIVIKWVKRATEKYVSPSDDAASNWEVEDVFKTLSQVVVQATHEISEVAPTDEESRPEKVMSSTLITAIIKNQNAIIGNTGNSRAFIVTEDYIEQVNLDDDVWHARLRSGLPPEEVATKRGNSLLRRVIGACMREGDRILPDLRRVRFTGYRTYLAPGDVLLMCSDGLIEDGAFVSAAEAHEIIRSNPGKSAQEICDTLINLANDRQMPPKHGDNISCMIVKVSS